MPRWIVPVIAGIAALAVLGTSAVAVVQYRSAQQSQERAIAAAREVIDLRDRVAELEQETDRLEEETDRLEQDLEDAGSTDPLGDLLGDLLGDGGGALGELGDLGDVGDLSGLLAGVLGSGDVPGMECMLPRGGAGGLLDGLLGGGGGEPVPDDPQELVAQVAEQVAELRELSWTDAPEVAFLDDGELRRRLGEIMDDDYPAEDAELEGRYLQALGAVPPGTDMGQLRRQLMEEQVAGFYDPETGELVVRTPSGQISAADRVALAHELDHALTDQALGLPDLEAERFAQDQDALLATLAVVEGDATLLMNHWALGSLGLGDQMALATDPAILGAQDAMDQMPAYLGAELMFPYTTGLDHVCDRWLEDGWASVDDAYDAAPTTSAEVLWPGHPGAVGSPDGLSAPRGYEQAHATTFGAAHLLWLLEAPGGEQSRALTEAEDRAQAWGAGRMTVWFDGEDTSVGLALVDRGTAAITLCDTVTGWYEAAFPNSTRTQADGATTFQGASQSTVVACPGDQVHVAIAPDVATATTVVQ